MPRSLRPAAALLLAVSLASAVVAVRPALSQTASPTPKAGGTLKIMTREDTPQGFTVQSIFNFGRFQEVWRDG
jgi:hypothetical protein